MKKHVSALRIVTDINVKSAYEKDVSVQVISKLNDLHHEKTCPIPYANNRDED